MRSLLVPLVRRDRLELGIVAVHAWGVIAIVRDPEIAQERLGLALGLVRSGGSLPGVRDGDRDCGALVSGPRRAQG